MTAAKSKTIMVSAAVVFVGGMLLVLLGSLILPIAPRTLPFEAAGCFEKPNVPCLGRLAASMQEGEPEQGRAYEMVTLLSRMGMPTLAAAVAGSLPDNDIRVDASVTVLVGRMAIAAHEHPDTPVDMGALALLKPRLRLLARGRLAALLVDDIYNEPEWRRYSVPELDLLESMTVPAIPPGVSKPSVERLVQDSIRDKSDITDLSPGSVEISAVEAIIRASRAMGPQEPLRTASALVEPGMLLSVMTSSGMLQEFLQSRPVVIGALPSTSAAFLLPLLSVRDGNEPYRASVAARACAPDTDDAVILALRVLAASPNRLAKSLKNACARGIDALARAGQRGASMVMAGAALAAAGFDAEAKEALASAQAPPLLPSGQAGKLPALYVYALRTTGQSAAARDFLDSLPDEVRQDVAVMSTWMMPPGRERDILLAAQTDGLSPRLTRAAMHFSSAMAFTFQGQRDEAVRQFVMTYQDSRDDAGTPGAGFNTLLMTARALLALDRPVEAAQAMRRAWAVMPGAGQDIGIYMARYAALWYERFPDFDPRGYVP